MKKLFLLVTLLLLAACGSDEPTAEQLQVVSDFEAVGKEYVAATKGVVKDIRMEALPDSDIYRVYVFLDEKSWVAANESEKGSVASTIGRQMKQLSDGENAHVTLLSYENGDKLAEPNFANDGYNIIR